MAGMDAQRLRYWWFQRQALPRLMENEAPDEVLLKTGWSRSVAGANPYVTLFSRAGTSREAVDAAVANVKIHELPCSRGCTYVVPHQDFALALKVGQSFQEAGDIQGAKRHLGVTDQEIDHLGDRILDALGKGAMDPASLKTAVGDAVRNLGAEGKKRGMTTTLPLALGRLQSSGEIRRQPINGRLDQQRYAYARWEDNPLRSFSLTAEEAYIELARKFFRWIAPATPAHFQWFSGLGVKAAKAAMEPLGLEPIDEGSPLLMFADDREELLGLRVPSEPQYVLVTSLDGIFMHRREISALVADEDLTRKVPGEKTVYEMGAIADMYTNAILDRGRIVGLWEFDAFDQSLAWTSFIPADDAIKAAIAQTETYARDQLGDVRSFSLDSPESRKGKIEFLRTAGN